MTVWGPDNLPSPQHKSLKTLKLVYVFLVPKYKETAEKKYKYKVSGLGLEISIKALPSSQTAVLLHLLQPIKPLKTKQ